jgi:predicted kinase
MFFVQMSGFPGSGKSTLARQIGKRTGAVIIDHDIIKSALLNTIEETPIHGKQAGKISYNIDWSLIEFHLSQGHNVI